MLMRRTEIPKFDISCCVDTSIKQDISKIRWMYGYKTLRYDGLQNYKDLRGD